jgi:hypothetical protein
MAVADVFSSADMAFEVVLLTIDSQVIAWKYSK